MIGCRAQGAAEHGRGQANRPQARDQQAVLAADLHPPQGLIGRAEAAGAEGPVDVGERVGKANAGVFLGQQVRGVAAVTLPAVGRPALAPATDHITVLALVADTAPGDMIDHHPVARLEPLAARPHLDDLPARLVAGDHPLVALRALCPDVRDRWPGCRCRKWTMPSSAPEPGRGQARGSEYSLNSTVLLPGKINARHGRRRCAHDAMLMTWFIRSGFKEE